MFTNAVTIPLTLAMSAFNSGIAAAKSGINTLLTQVVSASAVSARAIGAIAIGVTPTLQSVGSGIVSAFSTANLLKIRAINDATQMFVANLLLSATNLQRLGITTYLSAIIDPTVRALVITSTGIDGAIIDLTVNSVKGFNKLGAAAKVNVAGIALGAFVALSSAIPVVSNQLTLANQIFVTGLIPNIQTLNALIIETKSFFRSNLLTPARYADFGVLAGIVRNLLPQTFLLGKTLNAIAVPIKFLSNLQTSLTYFRLMKSEITLFANEINNLSVGLIQSAGNLLQGGGFLMPGQVPAGPTALNAFSDKQQAVQEAVEFDMLTRNFEAVAKWSGAAGEAIDGVKREILQLQGATGQASDKTAEMAAILQRSNQPIEYAASQLRVFANAASATNGDIIVLGSTILDLLDSFGMGAEQTDRVTNALTAVSLKTGTTIEMLSRSLKVSGVTAKESNQSFEETLIAIGLLSSGGIEANLAGTALVDMLTNLKVASNEITNLDFSSLQTASTKGKALAALGLTKEDISTAQGELKPLTEIIPNLQSKVAAFKAASGAGATTTLLTSIFGQEDLRAVTALLASTPDQINNLTSAISNSGGVAQKITGSQMSNLSGTLERLNGAAIGISTTLGQMLSPILNTVLWRIMALMEGFLKLPSAIQAVAFSLSVTIPVILFYFKATKTVLYFNRLLELSKVALGVALDIYTGKLSISTVITNISNEATKVKLFLAKGLSFALDVLTGKTNLQTAQQIILNAATKFGNANYQEYIGTTLQAGKILLKNLATLGLMIVAWQALSELFKQSPGAKIAGDIDKATQELSKFRGELEWQKNAPEIITDLQTSFTNFADNLQSKGFAEAMRIQLTLIQDAIADTKSAVDAYGQGWIVTGDQLGNQKSMFALERQLQSVHSVLDNGISIMQKYGVETLDAADKQRLGVSGISAFKAVSEEQIKVLSASVEAMRKQAPATEEQKQLQQSNIKLAERQINTLRTKIQALESDTFAEQINNKAMQAKILTLDEVTKKYKKLADSNELMNLKSTASIEEMIAKGEGRGGVSEKQGAEQQRGLDKIGITQRVQSNKNQIKDLKAASIGATPEDAVKINDELKRLEIDQIKVRIDAAKLEQQARKNINDEILVNTKEREDSLVAKQELASQNQITAIKKAQAARTYSAEEAATKIAAIESADLQASIARETEKQQKLKQLREWGVISEEDMRKGLRDSQSAIAKTQGQLAESELKKSEERAAAVKKAAEERIAAQVKAIEEQSRFAKLKPERELARLDARSFTGDQQGKIAAAQSGVGDAQSELDKQRLGFALQLAELNNNQAQQEQIKGQIYQQQLTSLVQQQQAKRQELAISQQQQAIELERKRIQSELAVVEAQSALQTARAQGASAGEIAGLQQSIALKRQIVAQVATEQANQGKLNNLSSQQLAIQQQTAKEGLQQQRQIELERQAIEKKTRAIEDGLNRARALSEARSQTLEFKGQDIGAEISKQKLLADISQSQSNLQKQRLEFSLQSAELAGSESNKEQLKQQIYQQQQASLTAQQQAQRTSLQLSNQQAAIELERKRIGAEIALLEAQANLESAQAKNASASEIASLQAVIALRQKSVGYISTEEANQNKINQLTSQHLTIEQQIAREGLAQQRQLELQKLAIEKRTKAIEDGLIRARTALEGQSQKLEFKGQSVGGEVEKQKGVADLQQSQAALQKQQLDFALQRAELTGNESAKEQVKEQIYQQQKAALIAQQQAQVVGIGLSRQQAAIELERQKLSAQIALTEAQANLAKAQVTKGSSAAELESLRAAIGYRQQALGQITAQAAVSKSVQATEDRKLAIERQTTMENLVQTRELERQKQAIEKQKQAIEDRLQAQKSSLENRQGKLELSNQLLDLESRQLSARSGLTEATNSLEQQRLEFLMSQAEITGNTAQKEQLKTQLYQQQLAALDRSQQAQQQSFEISQKQKQIELDKQEIQAKIGAFEAEANIAKAKADNSSAQQISALESIYKLRQETLNQVGQMRTAEGQIASLERQKLSVEQLSAREKLRQTNQLEKMRAAHEANNKAIEKSTQLEKEKSAAQQTSIDTSGGLSWVDKAGPAWFEGAKNSFQQAAEEYLAATIPPDLTVTPTTNGTVPAIAPVAGIGKTPDTPQQLANMQISAQNVYLNGAIAESKPTNWLSDAIAPRQADAVGTGATSQETAKARIEQAQTALSEAIARHNAQGRSLTIDPAEAARQGLAAAADARARAAQIREDLRTGVLKNQVSGTTAPINLPPTLFELQDNLIKAEAALKEIKANTPATITDIYKSITEIKDLLKNLHTGNLTVVSQNPVAECGEILNALTRRR